MLLVWIGPPVGEMSWRVFFWVRFSLEGLDHTLMGNWVIYVNTDAHENTRNWRKGTTDQTRPGTSPVSWTGHNTGLYVQTMWLETNGPHQGWEVVQTKVTQLNVFFMRIADLWFTLLMVYLLLFSHRSQINTEHVQLPKMRRMLKKQAPPSSALDQKMC